MKSNVKENIGYISIAIVVALTLVLSFVAIDTYQNSNIVANAQVELEGETYSDITISDYSFISSYSFISNGSDSFALDFQPLDGYVYYVELIVENSPVAFGGFIHCNNGYARLDFNSQDLLVLGTGSLYPLSSNFIADQYHVLPICFAYDTDNEFYTFCLFDFDGYTASSHVSFLFYLVSEVQNTTDTFLSLIGDGITFGFDSIATGVTYTMDSLFIVDGEFTNFSIVLFITLGVGLALAIIKYVLHFIFSLGGNRKW